MTTLIPVDPRLLRTSRRRKGMCSHFGCVEEGKWMTWRSRGWWIFCDLHAERAARRPEKP